MAMLPKNPAMLLSVVNTKLRDFYDSLAGIGYTYDAEKNQFV